MQIVAQDVTHRLGVGGWERASGMEAGWREGRSFSAHESPRPTDIYHLIPSPDQNDLAM
jgi:hypothetical protein